MDEYAIYLRKSRADVEAEARGGGETLARHRKALLALADKQGYHIGHIYQEIVSGDTIAARPEMKSLLKAVEAGKYAGVIVNDMDRLGRGDSVDQAIIRDTFKSSNTLIITPAKTYDLSREYDEDFADFGMFLARFEYKQIKRRMVLGRRRAAAEGNWIGSHPPYGYEKIKRPDGRGYTLKIIPHEADIVRLIFAWTAEGMSHGEIARRLMDMGENTRMGSIWRTGTIRWMLRNTTYIGDYVYGKHSFTDKWVDGKKKRVMVAGNPTVAHNVMPPIVEREVFDKVQRILDGHTIPSKHIGGRLSNPLAGLVKCGICGKTMIRHVAHKGMEVLTCDTYKCPTVCIGLKTAEKAILDGLQGWVVKYTITPEECLKSPPTASEMEMEELDRQKVTIEGQIDKLMELVEKEVYTPQEYLRRKAQLSDRLERITNRMEELKKDIPDDVDITGMQPQLLSVLDVYDEAINADEKNEMLKSLLWKVEYRRDKVEDVAKIVLYPKLKP